MQTGDTVLPVTAGEKASRSGMLSELTRKGIAFVGEVALFGNPAPRLVFFIDPVRDAGSIVLLIPLRSEYCCLRSLGMLKSPLSRDKPSGLSKMDLGRGLADLGNAKAAVFGGLTMFTKGVEGEPLVRMTKNSRMTRASN